ncbi:MAG: exopolysaccharide biosynthesis polyprenyl glycosylphosphotransferase [Candidatus Firestonebacteria bacterium]|nr:exopolysaccharide biosynthesis polyprenyl glycosylphosphotransferase [Candidatus Firestonebacteria bacterium]
MPTHLEKLLPEFTPAHRVKPNTGAQKKILMIGHSSETLRLAEKLNQQADGYMVLGCIGLSNREPVKKHRHAGFLIFGDLSELEIFMDISPVKPDILLISDPEIRHHQILKCIYFARLHNLEAWARPQLAASFFGDLKFSHFYGHPIIKIIHNLNPFKLLIKNLFDYTLAILAALLLLPIMLCTALAIRATSRGPVFFRQSRVGLNGHEFKVIKFRSMFQNAEQTSGQLLSPGPADQRVTPLGRFLRKTHLDELPQLFNVLNGSMSLVGPRPERQIFVERFSQAIPFYSERFKVKPGITGIAQVYGSYHSRADDKLIFDLNYINNLSLTVDIKIILLTLWNAWVGLFVRETKSPRWTA